METPRTSRPVILVSRDSRNLPNGTLVWRDEVPHVITFRTSRGYDALPLPSALAGEDYLNLVSLPHATVTVAFREGETTYLTA